jgi:hypothetical protein
LWRILKALSHHARKQTGKYEKKNTEEIILYQLNELIKVSHMQ